MSVILAAMDDGTYIFWILYWPLLWSQNAEAIDCSDPDM